MAPLGKLLIVFGLVIVGLGIALLFVDKIPFVGKLPGDINIKRDHLQFFFPLATSIIISIVLSGILWLIAYLNKR